MTTISAIVVDQGAVTGSSRPVRSPNRPTTALSVPVCGCPGGRYWYMKFQMIAGRHEADRERHEDDGLRDRLVADAVEQDGDQQAQAHDDRRS